MRSLRSRSADGGGRGGQVGSGGTGWGPSVDGVKSPPDVKPRRRPPTLGGGGMRIDAPAGGVIRSAGDKALPPPTPADEPLQGQ